MALLVQQVDERHEQESLQPVQVQVFRRTITRHHHNQTARIKALEQPFQDHRVSNIQYLEFVDAQHEKLIAKLIADNADGILRFSLQLLIDSMLSFMDLEHEFLIMQKQLVLRLYINCFKELFGYE